MARRSLTLLETLIALVLVMALAALVFPSFLNSLGERAFESAADLTNEQLMLARAHAQATGAPVEVTYRADTSQVQARLFEPGRAETSSPAASSPQARVDAEPGRSVRRDAPGNAPNASEAATREGDDRLILEPWATRLLNRSIRIVTQPPAEPTDSASAPVSSAQGPPRDYQTLDDLLNGSQEVRLAVFMPDGSALLGDPVWLDDGEGRRGVLTINPFSGIPLFQRLAVAATSLRDEKAAADDPQRNPADRERSTKSLERSGRPTPDSAGGAARISRGEDPAPRSGRPDERADEGRPPGPS